MHIAILLNFKCSNFTYILFFLKKISKCKQEFNMINSIKKKAMLPLKNIIFSRIINANPPCQFIYLTEIRSN